MARWQPDARGRLGQAAMDLYGERGFEATTVAEIAERAGLTERTFFRHFADKREVLFSGGELLQQAAVDAVIAAAPDAAPIDVVASAMERAGSDFLDGNRVHSLARQAIIDSHPELQERELIKMARLSDAVAAALRERGVAEPAATITAQAGILIFGVAFERWQTAEPERPFAEHAHEALAGLRSATAVA